MCGRPGTCSSAAAQARRRGTAYHISAGPASATTVGEITQAADANVAATVVSGELDIAIVDVDFDVDGGIKTIQAAKQQTPPVPEPFNAGK